MLTADRGNAAEAAILAALIKHGYFVLPPFGDGQPYDLVVDLEGPFLRVQCKRGWLNQGCIVFKYARHRSWERAASYLGRADVFGVYFAPTDSVYLIPIGSIPKFGGRLRLEPTRNNQRRGIRMAADFEIDRWAPARLAGLVPTAAASAA